MCSFGMKISLVFRPVESYECDSLPGELVIAELEQKGQAAFEEQTLVERRESGENSSGKDSNKDLNKDSVWNRCQFQCALCSASFTDRRNIKSHVVTTECEMWLMQGMPSMEQFSSSSPAPSQLRTWLTMKSACS